MKKLAVGDKIIAYSLESEVVFIDQKSKKILVKNTDGSVCYGNAKSVKKTFGITMTDEQAAKLDAMVLISYDKNEFKDIKVKKESKDQLDLNLEKNPAPVVDTSSSTPLKVGDIVKIPHLASFRIILDIKDGKALIHTCPSDSIAIKEKSITAAEARKYIDFSFLNRLNRDNGISIYSSDNIYGFNWMPLSSVTKENVNWNNVASVSSIKAEDVVCLPSGEIVVVKGIIDDSIFFDYAYGNYSTVCQDWQYFFGGGKTKFCSCKRCN